MICFPVKKKKEKGKAKTTHQNPHTNPQFVSLLCDLSTEVTEEVTGFTGFYTVVGASESQHWTPGFLPCFPSSLRCRILRVSTTDSTIHDRFLVWCFSSDNKMWSAPSPSMPLQQPAQPKLCRRVTARGLRGDTYWSGRMYTRVWAIPQKHH